MHAPDETETQRRRRGGRTLTIGCGAATTVLTVALFGYLGWANALPKPVQVARDLPTPNGYDACFAAAQDLAGVGTVGPMLRTPWEADPSDLRREVEPRRGDLDALRRAMRLKYLTPAELTDADFTRHREYRTACQLFVAEARLALAAGDRKTALERSLDAIELGNKIGQGGPYLHNLVRATCQTLGVEAAERCFGRLDPETARSLGGRLDRVLSEMPNAGDIAEDERRLTLNHLRLTLSGRAPLPSTPSDGSEESPLVATSSKAVLFLYPKVLGYRKVDEHWKAVAAELRKPYHLRNPVSVLPVSDPVLGRATNIGVRAGFSFTSVETLLRVLRARFAVEEFRGRNGRLPAGWEEVVPAVLPAAPEDPFSGKSLRYVRQGSSYLLYSVGPDRQDDHGTPVSKRLSESVAGDYVAGKLIPTR